MAREPPRLHARRGILHVPGDLLRELRRVGQVSLVERDQVRPRAVLRVVQRQLGAHGQVIRSGVVCANRQRV